MNDHALVLLLPFAIAMMASVALPLQRNAYQLTLEVAARSVRVSKNVFGIGVDDPVGRICACALSDDVQTLKDGAAIGREFVIWPGGAFIAKHN